MSSRTGAPIYRRYPYIRPRQPPSASAGDPMGGQLLTELSTARYRLPREPLVLTSAARLAWDTLSSHCRRAQQARPLPPTQHGSVSQW